MQPRLSPEKLRSRESPEWLLVLVGLTQKTQTKKCRVKHCAVPSDTESETEVPTLMESEEESEQSSSGDEAVDRMSRAARRSLREEANSLLHLLTHKPNNPYCDACRTAKRKEKKEVCWILPEYDYPLGAVGHWGPHGVHAGQHAWDLRKRGHFGHNITH